MARKQASNGPWRNRIIGEADEDPTQLLANPLNWRLHPGRQRDAMRGTLSEVGWVQRVIVNRQTGHVIDGHLRIEEAISAGAETIPVLYVDLSPEEEKIVLATLDPIGAMASQSSERLRELLDEVAVDSAALMSLIEKMRKDYGDAYTGVITVPRYEPTGERPATSALRDEAKADKLRADIRAADLDEDIRDFLLAAAGRHTVFDYGAIAEFYAHASADVQRLMEASALIIIDYENAIRDGYVQFTEAISALAEEDMEADAVA